jgi:hypothetical protein
VERELREVEDKAAAISSASAEAQREYKVIQAVRSATLIRYKVLFFFLSSELIIYLHVAGM